MSNYLANAFSFNMIPAKDGEITFIDVTAEEATRILNAKEWHSVVGHADTAAVMSSLLGLDVPVNRASVELVVGDRLIVGQYSGPRLPEGATTLPEGAQIRWIYVQIHPLRLFEY
jgi:hypothetical protein